MKNLSTDERATALSLPRSFDATPAPANYWPRFYKRVRMDIADRRFYHAVLFAGASEAGWLTAIIALSILCALVFA